MINLLCCGDTHGNAPPQTDIIPVAWLHAGDFYHHGDSHKTPKIFSLNKANLWLDLTTPIFSVRGNHDCFLSVPFFDKSHDVTGSCAEIIPGLMVVGLGWHGGMFYDLPLERDMQRVCNDAKRAYNLKTKLGDQIILLTHYPPWIQSLYAFNSDPNGWMFSCIKQLVDEIKPLVIVQGHVHELAGKQLIYKGPGFNSLIVHPGPKGGLLQIALPAIVNFSPLP